MRVINVTPAYIRTNIHQGMGISFEEHCHLLGNPDFLTAEEDIVVARRARSSEPSRRTAGLQAPLISLRS